jgi:hypothetical protein
VDVANEALAAGAIARGVRVVVSARICGRALLGDGGGDLGLPCPTSQAGWGTVRPRLV